MNHPKQYRKLCWKLGIKRSCLRMQTCLFLSCLHCTQASLVWTAMANEGQDAKAFLCLVDCSKCLDASTDMKISFALNFQDENSDKKHRKWFITGVTAGFKSKASRAVLAHPIKTEAHLVLELFLKVQSTNKLRTFNTNAITMTI